MIPCEREPEPLWTSEDSEERDMAAAACAPCPRKDACLAGARERNETWGVWGGVDLSGAKNPRAAQCQNRECGKPVDRNGTRRQYCDAVCRSREAYLSRRGAA